MMKSKEYSKILYLANAFILIGIAFTALYWLIYKTIAPLICFVIVFLVEFFVGLIRLLITEVRPLDIRTPDGYNQGLHPSVLFFEDPWNGYHYWMAYTPFPLHKKPYSDRYENPCVVCSNDGKKWFYPGLVKPLDDLTQEEIEQKDYFSDPCLVYDALSDSLVCYYRLNTGNEKEKDVYLIAKKTIDGLNWSERIYNTVDTWKTCKEPVVSPSIIKENGHWVMMYVDKYSKPRSIYIAVENETCKWISLKRCCLEGKVIQKPWHLDLAVFDDKYYLTLYDLSEQVTLWRSDDGINYSFVKVLIKSEDAPALFCNATLYKSCLVKDHTGYKLYFSGGNGQKMRIGLMEGKKPEELKLVSAPNKKYNIELLARCIEDQMFVFRYIFRKINVKRTNKAEK